MGAILTYLTPEEAKDKIKQVAMLANPPTMCFLGLPGIGKTYMAKDAAKEIGAELEMLSLAKIEPCDVKGVPVIVKVGDTNWMEWAAPTLWKKVIELGKAGKKVIVLLDEATVARADVQNAILDIIHTKEVDGIKLPDSTMFILLGNMGGDDGTFAQGFSSAIISRCCVFGVMQPDYEDWIAYEKPVPYLQAFVETYQHKVMYTTCKKDAAFEPYTTARGLSKLNQICAGLGWLDQKGHERDIQAFAKSLLAPDTADLLYRHIADNVVDPTKMFDMEPSAWKQYERLITSNDKLGRERILREVLEVAVPDRTTILKPDAMTALGDKLSVFFDKLEEIEPVKAVKTAFGRKLGARQPLVHAKVKVKGTLISKFYNELLKKEIGTDKK